MTEDRITISWDGETIEARAGEPVACALYRAGVRIQTRSIKYHRARGPQCFTGDCPGCMVRVDGVPNVRGCRVPATDGLEVESQVGRPSAQTDVFAIVDRVFGHFDHERQFVRPRLVREVYQAIARRMAGFGTAPTGDVDAAEGTHPETEVLVVGGGPAGLAAAHAAADAGAQVLHVDEAGFGGSLLHTPRDVDGGPHGTAPGPKLAERLALDDVERREGTVIGRWEDATAFVERTDAGVAVHTVDADSLVLAVGATERAALVDGSDRPGVMGARAARILLNRWGVPPGDPVAVLDPGREGTAFAREARQAGLTVQEIDEALAIEGSPDVTGVRTPDGHVDAAAVALDPGLTPAPELGRQAGVPYTYEDALGGRVPLHDPDGATPIPGVLVAGSCAGLHTPEAALRQGQLAGRRAAGQAPTVDIKRLLEAAGLSAAERTAIERVWRRP